MLKLDKSKNTGIIFIYDLVGYEFKIKKIYVYIFYEPWLIEILRKDFDPKYLKLVARIISFLNDETDDDANALMVELEEMTMIFYNKYAKYLSKDTIKKYLKQINILKNELNLYEYKKDILSSRRR